MLGLSDRYSNSDSDGDGVFYFLGNITSHVVHALPLWKEMGGEFVVLSHRAREQLEPYGVPVRVLDDLPRRWRRTGRRFERTDQYLHVPAAARRTVRFLERHARVVLFYELFDFGARERLRGPTTVFFGHGNSAKPYLSGRDRLRLLGLHDHVVAPGPHGRTTLERAGIRPEAIVDLGLARTDEVVARRGSRVISPELTGLTGDVRDNVVLTYAPTYWGPSSVDSVGLSLLRSVRPDQVLLVRLHPQTPEHLVAQYRRLADARPHVHLISGDAPGLGLLDLLAAADVVVGDLSSVMLEALLLFKPLAFALDADSERLLTHDHPLAAVVARSVRLRPGAADLAESLDAAAGCGVDDEVWAEAARRLFFHVDGGCVAHTAEFVRSLVSPVRGSAPTGATR